MPFEIIRKDITKLKVDAIVNPSQPDLMRGGGVNGAIHKVAGDALLQACRALGGCKTGEVKLTEGFGLPAKYVIHTVGVVYQDGKSGEQALLANCYRNALALAKEKKLKSIAFPLISTGAYGYPKNEAIRVAINQISEFLMENEMRIYLVVFDKDSFAISEKLFGDITEYLDNYYIDEREQYRSQAYKMCEMEILQNKALSLESIEERLEETFSQRLLRLIDERGKTDVEVYKKANVDRKLFSKIRKDMHYKPSKNTVLAFSIALELSLEDTKDLLRKAGYALSRSNRFDVIIEYFLEREIYNIFEINEALFAFEQNLLGV